MRVGEEIGRLRRERGMTQEEFGALFHVTRQTVSNWENSKSYPDLETLVRLSEEFGVTLDHLMKGDRTMIRTIDRERLLPGMNLAGQRDLTAWLDTMREGQNWRFDLLASPTKKVMQDGRKNSQRRILRTMNERLAWLERKGEFRSGNHIFQPYDS